uniref:Uncharacterized protein n=1 Tax=Caenorhabditis tropicalis TaxID=1561998 RepID=A0A1I7T0C8_9PELO
MNDQVGGFNERRLVLLLDDLDKNKNVGCVLKELAKLKIPETTARSFNVVERVTPFQTTPGLDKLVAIIIRKNKRMSELNRIRRVRFAEKKSKKAKIVIVSSSYASSDSQSSSGETPSFMTNAPTPAEFPLRYGPGLHHSAFSPFRIVHPKPIEPSPAVPPTVDVSQLRGLPYIQHLYQQVKKESVELSQVANPTVDQVLEEMNMVNFPTPSMLLSKLRR